MRAAALALVLVTGPLGRGQQPEKKDPPKPLPGAVVQAWKDAGAEVGWAKTGPYRAMWFAEKPDAGTVPAFRFRQWKAGVVAKLPAPKTPFGLDLFDTEVTDADLKELAHLKKLTALSLRCPKVTNAGLKELAALEDLTTLYLDHTRVTGASLKELAPLKNLTALSLAFTDVTDAGLKELAAFKNLTVLHLSVRGTNRMRSDRGVGKR